MVNKILYMCGAIIVATAIGYAGYQYYYSSKLSVSEWAAWAGAIGSMLTIAGSFLIAWNQGRRDEFVYKKRKLSEAVELVAVCEAITLEAYEAIKVVSKKYQKHENGDDFRYSATRLKNVNASIAVMLGKAIPAKMFKPLINMQRLVSYTIASVERRYRRDVDISDDAIKLLCNRAEDALRLHKIVQLHGVECSEKASRYKV
jgi:hypothetical protein